MYRNAFTSIIAAIVCLALVPVLWIVAKMAIPPLGVVVLETTSGGRLGPWMFTWALVWIATLAALVVAWLCYSTRNINA